MTQRLTLNDTWQLIITDGVSLVAQASKTAIVHIGSTPPADNAAGFNVKWGVPISFDLGAFGGSAWVKGEGIFTYAAV